MPGGSGDVLRVAILSRRWPWVTILAKLKKYMI